MEEWVYKVIILFLILFITLFFGLLPIRIVHFLRQQEWRNFQREPSGLPQNQGRSQKARQILGYLNCFAGGVFLGTCLLHLFPEVKDKYDDVMSLTDIKIKFPLSEMIISCGFFLVMLIEHGAMSLKKPHSHSHNHLDSDGHHSHDHHNHTDGHERPEVQPLLRSSNNPNNLYGTTGRQPQAADHDLVANDELITDYTAIGNSYASDYECGSQPPHHHHPGQTHDETEHIHGIRSLVLLLALSLHTIFEGLALGLETNVDNLWSLFGAISIHKALIAFTMGLQFTDTLRQKKVLLYMLIFSVVSPIGIATGTVLTSVSQSLALSITTMVLEGIAAGTFLYVTFFEVLQKELGNEEHSISKVIVIIVGFDIMALTMLFES